MDLGYDSFLAREAAAHEARQADADRKQDLITNRAIELGADAARFIAWCADRGQPLADIDVRSNAGPQVDALTALVAHAPAWIREIAVRALIDQADFSDVTVRYSTGHASPLDVALVFHAPAWLRGELVGWLSRDSMLATEVDADLRDEVTA